VIVEANAFHRDIMRRNPAESHVSPFPLSAHVPRGRDAYIG
jgi:hypothetical protein